MGTIAARDALRVLELTEQVAAGLIIATQQGLRLRRRSGDLVDTDLSPALSRYTAALDAVVPFVEEDQPLDKVLMHLCEAIAAERFTFDWNEARA